MFFSNKNSEASRSFRPGSTGCRPAALVDPAALLPLPDRGSLRPHSPGAGIGHRHLAQPTHVFRGRLSARRTPPYHGSGQRFPRRTVHRRFHFHARHRQPARLLLQTGTPRPAGRHPRDARRIPRQLYTGRTARTALSDENGPIQLASLSGRKIIPISLNASRYWSVRSWDRFQIPKPFSASHWNSARPLRSPPTSTRKPWSVNDSGWRPPSWLLPMTESHAGRTSAPETKKHRFVQVNRTKRCFYEKSAYLDPPSIPGGSVKRLHDDVAVGRLPGGNQRNRLAVQRLQEEHKRMRQRFRKPVPTAVFRQCSASESERKVRR